MAAVTITVLRLTAKLALVKLGQMLENLSILRYSPLKKGSENMLGADNQQERLSIADFRMRIADFIYRLIPQSEINNPQSEESSETTRQAPVM
jgi:hypothetical protein